MSKELTPRQRALIKARIDDPKISNKEAMRRAGYSKGSIDGSYSQRVYKGIIEEMRDALKKQGVDTTTLAKRIKKGIFAQKVSRASHLGRFGQKAIDDDLSTSEGYIKFAAELLGLKQTTNVNVTGITGMSEDDLKKLIAGLKE